MTLHAFKPHPMVRPALLLAALLASLFCTHGALAASAMAAPTDPALDPEGQLIAAINDIEQGRLKEAHAALEQLLKAQPNFRLAKLFHGELTAVLSGKALAPAQRMDDTEKRGLMEEAKLRLWQEATPPDTLPDVLLQLPRDATHAVVVDLAKARLYLIEQKDGRARLARDYYASFGKAGVGKQKSGDNRTPVGVYRVTGFIPDSKLPDFYGAGAFPVDYPNNWDRLHHRSGDGIWLHGVPRSTYSRAPRSSEGCVTLPNADLESLKPYMQSGRTPVVFADKVEWVSPGELEDRRDSFLAQLEQWRARWSSLDTEGYLAMYAEDFATDGMDRTAFAAHKRRVNAGKSSIDVNVSDVEVYRYPGAENLVLARFTQDYRSNNLTRSTRKEQYWRQSGKGWQIVRESSR